MGLLDPDGPGSFTHQDTVRRPSGCSLARAIGMIHVTALLQLHA